MAVNYFQLLAEQMKNVGLVQYLFPFILLTAIFYAILRKSKLFGESVAVNGVIAVVASLMIVFGVPVAAGAVFATRLSIFLMQASVFLIIILMAFILASLFYPKMMDWLPEAFKTRSVMTTMVALAIVFFITSGLLGVFTTGWGGGGGGGTTPIKDQRTNIVIFGVGLLIFIVVILISTVITKEVGK